MNDTRRDQLAIKMLLASYTVKDLLSKIAALEVDEELSLNEKFSQIKMIREEMTKVGTEIDNIKREFTLLNAYSVN